MKRNWLLICILLVLLAVLPFSLNKFASAQNSGQGLEVSPPSQEVTADPGTTVTVKAKIRNRGNNTLPMNVHIEDFTAKGEEGQVQLNANSSYSVVSWTTVDPTNFELGPGEEKEVTATIKVPEGAAGGRFGSFVFGVNPDKAEGNAAALSQQIASLFLVKIKGPVSEKLTIKDFTAPGFSEFGPVPFTVKFENKGNVHVKTYGLINVTDMFGNKVADIVVPATNVFPDASRNVRASLDKQFLFGKYTATALMYYGGSNDNLSATTTFIVFPVRIAGGIAIVLLILFLMRKRLKKALKALGGK